MADSLIYGYRVFIESQQKYYSVVGIRGDRSNSILRESILIVTLNGNEFFTCSFNMQKAELGNLYFPDSYDYFPFESTPVKSLGEKTLFTYKINNTFNFDEFQKYSNIFYKYSLNGNIFRIEKHNAKVLDVDIYPISNQIISNNCTIIPLTSNDIESPLTLIKIEGEVNVLRKIEALEVSSTGVIKNVLNIANADNNVNIPCNLVTGQHIIFIPEDVINNIDYQVLYYNIIAQQLQLDPEPELIDTELEITSYPDYNDTNVNNSVGFNGLVKYFTNNTELTAALLSSNVYLNGVGSNTVFVNSGIVNAIKIYPLLRTKVEYNNGSQAVVVYENAERPISVTITNVINHDNEISTKYENIPYNQPYILPLGGAKQIVTTIHFKVDENTELEKTIQFFYLPSTLYTRLVTNSLYEFDSNEYTALIDWTTGESAEVSKWGCLLLTNEFEEIWDVEVNGETKKAAELVPTTKVRLGNLNGIYNETFGVNQPKGFGLYGESVYLTGNFYLNNGKSLVDINNDLLLANGNIERIRQTIANLDNSLHNSIYNLTLETAGNYANSLAAIEAAKAALTSDFNTAIATNSEAVFKLSKDYALWAVGNAGIAIINPNVAYNEEDGSIDDSTVGDGDEYLLLQGESVQIATNKTENGNIKVVCTTVNPAGFKYSNNNLFNPKDGNDNNVIFKIGWITPAALSRATKHKVEISSGDKLFRYVALNKADGTGNGHQWGNRTFYTNPPLQDTCNVYSFTSYLTLDSLDSIYIKSDGLAVNGSTTLSGDYYIIPDVVIAGMFENGKFNASLIEVENIVAVGGGTKNPNFNVNNVINSGNYPTTNTTNPFVVISGTTGKVTALGMLMKEATIGDVDHEHIKITDNNGINVTPDYNVNSQAQKPAIYFRNGTDIITEISSKKDTLSNFFNTTASQQIITANTFYLGDVTLQYDRNLQIANSETVTDCSKNKTIIYEGNYYFKYNPQVYLIDDITLTADNPYYSYNSDTGVVSKVGAGTYSVSVASTWYIKNNNEHNLFIPTRVSAYYTNENNFFITNIGLTNSDIGIISYSKNGNTATTFEKSDFSNSITLLAGKIYEISVSCSAQLSNLINNVKLIKSKYREVNEDEDYQISNSNSYIGGLRPYAEGYFTIKLTIGLYQSGTLKHKIKTIMYSESVQKSSKAELCTITSYLYDNNIYDIDTTSSNVMKNIPYLIKNTNNQFSESVRFSKLILVDSDLTYQLKLVATVEFSLSSLMSDFKYYNYNAPNSGSGSAHLPDIIDTAETMDDYGGGEYSNLGTPKNDGYNWAPLMCPVQYTISPKIEISNFSLTVTVVNLRTIIQGNGFLTGYEDNNHFEVSFTKTNSSIKFKKAEFVLGIGSVLSNDGLFNAFKLDNSEYTIKKLIPILCGTFYPSKRLKQYSGTNARYTYYNFSGYSLINNTDINASDIGGPNLDTYLLTDLFKNVNTGYLIFDPYSYRIYRDDIIYGTIYYMKSYDLYICNKVDSGRITIMFGNYWNKLFSRYGTNVIVQITPKYYELIETLSAQLGNMTTIYNNPVVVNNSAIYRNQTFSYKSVTSISGNTVSYSNSVSKTSLLGLEFDCWNLIGGLSKTTKTVSGEDVLGNASTTLEDCTGMFDVTINYIPDLS